MAQESCDTRFGPVVHKKFVPFSPNNDPHKVGIETIDGIRTTHYRYSQTIPATQYPGVLTKTPPQHLVFDVWIDSHNLIRRFMLASDTDIETERYFDYGASFPPITAPPADKVTDNPVPSTPDITRVPAPPIPPTAPPTTAPTQVPAP